MNISHEEYDKARQLIEDYKKQINQEFVKEMVCICCKQKVIEPLYKEITDALKPWEGCWNDGTVKLISFGYGSRLDLDSYLVAICDDCMIQLDKEGLVIDYKELKRLIGNRYGS